MTRDTCAVTGAFSYTGKAIAAQLLARGYRVITLTGHPERPHPFGERLRAFPYHFERPQRLAASLQGVTTLYNTYWVRFNRGSVTFELAVENTRRLLEAAAQAGVQRVVHLSVSNPAPDLPLPYFRCKWQTEQAVRASGLSFAILRPTLIFGPGDILINNLAYLLRRFPVFAIPGAGDYRLQPVHLEDVARAAVEAGERQENLVQDMAGPQVYTFRELVACIAAQLRRRVRLVRLPPPLALAAARLIGAMLGDVLLTRDELDGLMRDLLVSEQPPCGRLRLDEWLAQNREELGRAYASEVKRHF